MANTQENVVAGITNTNLLCAYITRINVETNNLETWCRAIHSRIESMEIIATLLKLGESAINRERVVAELSQFIRVCPDTDILLPYKLRAKRLLAKFSELP